jgi:hypothetical protein
VNIVLQAGDSPLESDFRDYSSTASGAERRIKGAEEGEYDSDYTRTGSPDPTSDRRTSTSIHSSRTASERESPRQESLSRPESRTSLNSSGSRLRNMHSNLPGSHNNLRQPSHDSDYNSPRTTKYSRTPTPVKSFLKDAGLMSGTSSQAVTPSVEHEDNVRRTSQEEEYAVMEPLSQGVCCFHFQLL